MKSYMKLIAAAFIGITWLLGGSYCSEYPKYRFAQTASKLGKDIPGTRLIGVTESVEIASPATWFWPTTTMFAFAMPDPVLQGRFLLISLLYDEHQAHNTYPDTHLLDVDCNTHDRFTPHWYGLDEPDTAFPARTLWGEPVVAPNGKTYRQMKKNFDVPSKWIRAFCETDWTPERQAWRNQ